MVDKITWVNEKRKLSELVPWEDNPAYIKEPEAKRLEESLDEFGQVQAIAISPENMIYDGHQRKTVWSASRKFGPDYEVDVRVASRELTNEEQKKLVVFLRRGAVGDFDWNILSGWETEKLVEWGLDEEALKVLNNDAVNLREMLAANFQFQPNENPMIGTVHYSEADILKEKLRLDGKFSDSAEYVQVTCPHCAQDFFLNRKEVK